MGIFGSIWDGVKSAANYVADKTTEILTPIATGIIGGGSKIEKGIKHKNINEVRDGIIDVGKGVSEIPVVGTPIKAGESIVNGINAAGSGDVGGVIDAAGNLASQVGGIEGTIANELIKKQRGKK